MDFEFSPDQEAFRKEVEAFLDANDDPDVFDVTRENMAQIVDTPKRRAFMKKLGHKGWLGMTWPETYGGDDGEGRARRLGLRGRSVAAVVGGDFWGRGARCRPREATTAEPPTPPPPTAAAAVVDHGGPRWRRRCSTASRTRVATPVGAGSAVGAAGNDGAGGWRRRGRWWGRRRRLGRRSAAVAAVGTVVGAGTWVAVSGPAVSGGYAGKGRRPRGSRRGRRRSRQRHGLSATMESEGVRGGVSGGGAVADGGSGALRRWQR